jgi:hypothetical protein
MYVGKRQAPGVGRAGEERLSGGGRCGCTSRSDRYTDPRFVGATFVSLLQGLAAASVYVVGLGA